VGQGNKVVDPAVARLRPAVAAQLTDPEPEKPSPSAAAESAAQPPADLSAPAGPAAGRHRQHVRVGRRLRAVGRALATWPERPSSRVALPGVLILSMVSVTGLMGGYVVPALPTSPNHAFTPLETGGGRGASVPGLPGGETPGAEPSAAASSPPPGRATQGPGALSKPSDLAGWAAPLSAKLGIPLPAMQAYGFAELATTTSQPGCQLRWTTLAGIGKIESDHGRHNAILAADGKALPPIIGAPLDGLGGRMAIADTDGGRLDGDKTWDHAVGPMQFIPSTWAKYGADADGDGVADINDVDDAALSAARYLCAGNRDLSQADGWWAAIQSYNALQSYARDVFNAANDYGLRSR
jgi:Transglycosylase SLT domain